MVPLGACESTDHTLPSHRSKVVSAARANTMFVDLAVSLAQAEIVQAGLQQELVGVLRNVLSGCEQIEQTRKDLATVDIKMAASQLDTSIISENIQKAQNAALDNLNSAIQTLWSTALPGQKEEGSAEQMVKGLAGVKWNWQVSSPEDF